MVAQTMNDTMEYYASSIDAQKMSLTLTKRNDKKWQANFTITRSSETELKLDGMINGYPRGIFLKREDETKFLVRSRGFHWVQEYPFNR
jgi:hypothetical protein